MASQSLKLKNEIVFNRSREVKCEFVNINFNPFPFHCCLILSSSDPRSPLLQRQTFIGWGEREVEVEGGGEVEEEVLSLT